MRGRDHGMVYVYFMGLYSVLELVRICCRLHLRFRRWSCGVNWRLLTDPSVLCKSYLE